LQPLSNSTAVAIGANGEDLLFGAGGGGAPGGVKCEVSFGGGARAAACGFVRAHAVVPGDEKPHGTPPPMCEESRGETQHHKNNKIVSMSACRMSNFNV
jgi:hypothetical protein